MDSLHAIKTPGAAEGSARVETSGHFTPLEIAMTIVVGIAAASGIWACLRLRSRISVWGAAAIFIVVAFAQIVCFRLSLLPGIARR